MRLEKEAVEARIGQFGMQELTEQGDWMEGMVERLTERVEGLEESKRRAAGARRRSS